MKKISLLILVVLFTILTKAQIPNYVPTSNLQAWYGFNGNANDLSGNGNHGVINGATLTTDQYANSNSAYEFNGVTSFINVPTLNNFQYTSVTYALWYNFNSLCSINSNDCWKMIIGRDQFGDLNQGVITLLNHVNNSISNKLYYYSGAGTSTTGISPNIGQWAHLTFVYDANIVQWYLNGSLVATNTFTFASNANIPFNIGSGGNRYFYHGKLDDIGIWNRALSSCEIQMLYNSGVSPVTATSSASLICVNQAATLTATGASSYTWNPGNLTGSSIVVSPTTTTTYSVAGTASATACVNSNTIVQNVSACTTIEEFTQQNSLTIYPNPNAGSFVIKSGVSLDVELYNYLGKSVRKIRTENNTPFSVENLEPGIYFINGKERSIVPYKIIVLK